ncbi:MAG TPA: hypothetical protein VFY06_15605 [Verrucomicrobiae bacterium]|nr:hypothetical protein [Verrucomicrobiae bacterium]
MNIIERATAYLDKMPAAIAGQGGHAATFAAACRLVEFGLSYEQAEPLLAGWNETHCQPRWTVTELRHKLTDAFKRTSLSSKFVTGRREFSPTSAHRPLNQSGCNRIPARGIAPNCDSPGKKPLQPEILTLLPKLREGTETDFAALAGLRGLSVDGLKLASARGLLRFGRYHGKPAWFILDASQRNACARRMDGQPWTTDGAKSFILRGSQVAWPVGIGEAREFPNVLLCEGAPDLLAACHFISAAGGVTDCAPVAMLSAVYRIPADTLTLFAGKRVRIYAHDDATGYGAASRWAAQLAGRAGVDAFSFAGLCTRDGQPVKDLNGFVLIQPADETLLANLLP